MNTKQKGNIALGVAIAYYVSKGWAVSLPLNDSQSYDMIVDKNGNLNKIQVKFTSGQYESGNYYVCLRSISGSTREVYRTVSAENCDELFVLCDNGNKYCIPSQDVTNRSQLGLNSNYKVE